MDDPKEAAAAIAAAEAQRSSFDELRNALDPERMTDDAFLAQMDPGGPDDGDPGDEADDAEALAAQVPKKSQEAKDKLKATEEGIDELEEGRAGDTTAKEGEAETDASPEDQAAYEEALRALRRVKVPDARLRTLSREEVLAWGGPLALDQRKTDGLITELQQLRSRQVDDPEKPEGGATNAPKTEAIPQADLSAKLAEVLGLDEEGGAVLRQGLDAIVAPLMARIEERDQRDARRDAAVARLMLKDAAAGLVDRFPQLKDPERLSQLGPKVIANLNTGAYDSMAAALEDAAKAAYYDELLASAVQATEKKALARARGRMSTPSQRPKSSESLSVDERLDAVLSGIDAGESDAEISARSGW